MANYDDKKTLIERAVEIGALSPSVRLDPENATARKLFISSKPKTIEDEIDLVVVHGGAGITVHKRLFHAVRAIGKDCVNMSGQYQIAILTGTRMTEEDECERIKAAGYIPAESEFELAINAVKELFPNAKIDDEVKVKPVKYGEEYAVRWQEAEFSLYDKEIHIRVCETPFAKGRKWPDGTLASNASFEEAMIPLLVNSETLKDKSILFISHDIWIPRATLLVKNWLPDTKVFGDGPYNLNRVRGDLNGDPNDVEIEGLDLLKKEIEAYDAIVG